MPEQMRPYQEIRAAVARLRDSHRLDGVKVDSDSEETLLLLRDLLASRDWLATWLESCAIDIDEDADYPYELLCALNVARMLNGGAFPRRGTDG